MIAEQEGVADVVANMAPAVVATQELGEQSAAVLVELLVDE
jgi:hypothetical protein